MKKEGKILVVDDNQSILESCVQLLKHDFEVIKTISNPNLIPSELAGDVFDVILLDMNFRSGLNTGNEGIYWLNEILAADPGAIVIMITAYGDVDLAVKAIKKGAFNFIQKPWEPARLIATIQSGIKFRRANMEVNKLKRRNMQIISDSAKGGNIILGNSTALIKCREMAGKVAATDANILLTGENGTGKELFAREIHLSSLRKGEAFVAVDMGAVSPTLFESELFGHRKGAFTDAHDDRIGRLELADRGTLFLDEIANLSMPMQAKLLTVLEQKEVRPVGSNEARYIDVRLISATNGELREMIDQNLFREDLLYRLNTIEIRIPALRDRGEDIILLADYFLEIFSKQYNKSGIRINSNAYDALMTHKWPGNVRELKHTLERAVILSDSGILKPDDFFNTSFGKDEKHLATEIRPLAEMERNLIYSALKKNNMNISRAAGSLAISRSTLYSKMKKYGI